MSSPETVWLCSCPGSPGCGGWAVAGWWLRTSRTGPATAWGWHCGTSARQGLVTVSGGTGSVSSPCWTSRLSWTSTNQSWLSTSSALKLILLWFLASRKYLIKTKPKNEIIVFCLSRTWTWHLWPISIGSSSVVLEVLFLNYWTEQTQGKINKGVSIELFKISQSAAF